jgi:pyruvate formate lyase activating enzyme
MVHHWDIHVEITTNVVPEYNDDDRTFQGIAEWIVGKLGEKIPWHITRYHPANKMYTHPTPLETMLRAREIGRAAGLKFIYLGNISDPEGDGTKCPGCGKTVIERTGFFAKKSKVEGGKCSLCGEDLGIKE